MADSRRWGLEDSRRPRREAGDSNDHLAYPLNATINDDDLPGKHYDNNDANIQSQHQHSTSFGLSCRRERAASDSSSSLDSSTASSLLDISRPYPETLKQGGVFARFFKAPSERKRVKRRSSGKKKKARVLYFGNSSTSSVNSDLAYGTGYIRRKKSRDFTQRSSSNGSSSQAPTYMTHAPPNHSTQGPIKSHTNPSYVPLNEFSHSNSQRSTPQQAPPYVSDAAASALAAGTAVGEAAEYYRQSKSLKSAISSRKRTPEEEILALGREIKALARRQEEDDMRAHIRTHYSKHASASSRISDHNKFKRDNKRHSHGLGVSKSRYNSSSDDSEWESASEDEESDSDDSLDSKLAYGSVVQHSARPVAPPVIVGSAAEYYDVRNFRDIREYNRKQTDVNLQYFGTANSLYHVFVKSSRSSVDRRSVVSSRHHEKRLTGRAECEDKGPMRVVYPVPTSDPNIFDAERVSVLPASHNTSSQKSRPSEVPLQYPTPRTPVSSKVYDTGKVDDEVTRRTESTRRVDNVGRRISVSKATTKSQSDSTTKKSSRGRSDSMAISEAILAGATAAVTGSAIAGSSSESKKEDRKDSERRSHRDEDKRDHVKASDRRDEEQRVREERSERSEKSKGKEVIESRGSKDITEGSKSKESKETKESKKSKDSKEKKEEKGKEEKEKDKDSKRRDTEPRTSEKRDRETRSKETDENDSASASKDKKSKRDSTSSKHDVEKEKEKDKSSKRSSTKTDREDKTSLDVQVVDQTTKETSFTKRHVVESRIQEERERREFSSHTSHSARRREQRMEPLIPLTSESSTQAAAASQFSGHVYKAHELDTQTTSPLVQRPRTPTVVTVDREPNFDSSPPDSPASAVSEARLSRKDSFELEQMVEESRRGSWDEYTRSPAARRRTGGTTPASTIVIGKDSSYAIERGIQEKADEFYRQSETSRRMESERVRRSERSTETSVVGKWREDNKPEPVRVITPPEYHKPRPSKYDGPDADVIIDNTIYPHQSHQYRAVDSGSGAPIFKSRDPSAKRDRPLLNLILPTPLPSRNPTPAVERPDAAAKVRTRERHHERKGSGVGSRVGIGSSSDDEPLKSERRQSTDEKIESHKTESGSSSSKSSTRAREEVSKAETSSNKQARARKSSISKSKSESSSSKSIKSNVIEYGSSSAEYASVVGPHGESETVPVPQSAKSVTWGEAEMNTYEVITPFNEASQHEVELKQKSPPREHRAHLTKSSRWGKMATTIVGDTREPANEPDVTITESPKPNQSERRRISPEWSFENVEHAPPVPGPKPASPQRDVMPGGYAYDIEFAAHVAAGLEDTGFDASLVLDNPTFHRRSSPPGSDELSHSGSYQRPMVESVSDLSTYEKSVSVPLPDDADFVLGEASTLTEELQSDAVVSEDVKKRSKKDKSDKDKKEKKDKKDKDKKEKKDKKKKKSEDEERRRKSVDVSQPLDTLPSSSLVEEPASIEITESHFAEDVVDKSLKKERSKQDSHVLSPSEASVVPTPAQEEENWLAQRGAPNRVAALVKSFDDNRSSSDSPTDSAPSESQKGKAKSKHDSTGYDSPSRSSSRHDMDLERSVSRYDELDEDSKASRKWKRDSYGLDSPSRSRSGSVARSIASVEGSSKKSKHSKRRSETIDFVGTDHPPDLSGRRRRFEDDDVTSVVSEPQYDDDRKRRSKRDSRHDLDDAKSIRSVTSSPGSSHKRKSQDNEKEKRSSGLFSGLFGGGKSSKDDEKKKDSLKDRADTPGAGVGSGAVGVAALCRLNAIEAFSALKNSNSRTEISENLEDLTGHVEACDPDIKERVIKPAIDPQYGDLLPLPPSEPGSPLISISPMDLPALPDSRPDTPPAERQLKRERSSHVRHRSILDTPVKSPSNTAIPLQLRYGQRQGPVSPSVFKSSPGASPVSPAPNTTDVGSPSHVKGRRPMSWDSSREIKPFYLLEIARRGEPPINEDDLPELPPSEASPSEASASVKESQSDAEDWDTADEYGDRSFDDTFHTPGSMLRLDTSLAQGYDGPGSEETTPKAGHFPELSTPFGGFPPMIENDVDAPASTDLESQEPAPVDSMSRDRSSYLLKSAPSSVGSNKTVDGDSLSRQLSELQYTPTKSRGKTDVLSDDSVKVMTILGEDAEIFENWPESDDILKEDVSLIAGEDVTIIEEQSSQADSNPVMDDVFKSIDSAEDECKHSLLLEEQRLVASEVPLTYDSDVDLASGDETLLSFEPVLDQEEKSKAHIAHESTEPELQVEETGTTMIEIKEDSDSRAAIETYDIPGWALMSAKERRKARKAAAKKGKALDLLPFTPTPSSYPSYVEEPVLLPETMAGVELSSKECAVHETVESGQTGNDLMSNLPDVPESVLEPVLDTVVAPVVVNEEVVPSSISMSTDVEPTTASGDIQVPLSDDVFQQVTMVDETATPVPVSSAGLFKDKLAEPVFEAVEEITTSTDAAEVETQPSTEPQPVVKLVHEPVVESFQDLIPGWSSMSAKQKKIAKKAFKKSKKLESSQSTNPDQPQISQSLTVEKTEIAAEAATEESAKLTKASEEAHENAAESTIFENREQDLPQDSQSLTVEKTEIAVEVVTEQSIKSTKASEEAHEHAPELSITEDREEDQSTRSEEDDIKESVTHPAGVFEDAEPGASSPSVHREEETPSHSQPIYDDLGSIHESLPVEPSASSKIEDDEDDKSVKNTEKRKKKKKSKGTISSDNEKSQPKIISPSEAEFVAEKIDAVLPSKDADIDPPNNLAVAPVEITELPTDMVAAGESEVSLAYGEAVTQHDEMTGEALLEESAGQEIQDVANLNDDLSQAAPLDHREQDILTNDERLEISGIPEPVQLQGDDNSNPLNTPTELVDTPVSVQDEISRHPVASNEVTEVDQPASEPVSEAQPDAVTATTEATQTPKTIDDTTEPGPQPLDKSEVEAEAAELAALEAKKLKKGKLKSKKDRERYAVLLQHVEERLSKASEPVIQDVQSNLDEVQSQPLPGPDDVLLETIPVSEEEPVVTPTPMNDAKQRNTETAMQHRTSLLGESSTVESIVSEPLFSQGEDPPEFTQGTSSVEPSQAVEPIFFEDTDNAKDDQANLTPAEPKDMEKPRYYDADVKTSKKKGKKNMKQTSLSESVEDRSIPQETPLPLSPVTETPSVEDTPELPLSQSDAQEISDDALKTTTPLMPQDSLSDNQKSDIKFDQTTEHADALDEATSHTDLTEEGDDHFSGFLETIPEAVEVSKPVTPAPEHELPDTESAQAQFIQGEEGQQSDDIHDAEQKAEINEPAEAQMDEEISAATSLEPLPEATEETSQSHGNTNLKETEHLDVRTDEALISTDVVTLPLPESKTEPELFNNVSTAAPEPEVSKKAKKKAKKKKSIASTSAADEVVTETMSQSEPAADVNADVTSSAPLTEDTRTAAPTMPKLDNSLEVGESKETLAADISIHEASISFDKPAPNRQGSQPLEMTDIPNDLALTTLPESGSREDTGPAVAAPESTPDEDTQQSAPELTDILVKEVDGDEATTPPVSEVAPQVRNDENDDAIVDNDNCAPVVPDTDIDVSADVPDVSVLPQVDSSAQLDDKEPESVQSAPAPASQQDTDITVDSDDTTEVVSANGPRTESLYEQSMKPDIVQSEAESKSFAQDNMPTFDSSDPVAEEQETVSSSYPDHVSVPSGDQSHGGDGSEPSSSLPAEPVLAVETEQTSHDVPAFIQDDYKQGQGVDERPIPSDVIVSETSHPSVAQDTLPSTSQLNDAVNLDESMTGEPIKDTVDATVPDSALSTAAGTASSGLEVAAQDDEEAAAEERELQVLEAKKLKKGKLVKKNQQRYKVLKENAEKRAALQAAKMTSSGEVHQTSTGVTDGSLVEKPIQDLNESSDAIVQSDEIESPKTARVESGKEVPEKVNVVGETAASKFPEMNTPSTKNRAFNSVPAVSVALPAVPAEPSSLATQEKVAMEDKSAPAQMDEPTPESQPVGASHQEQAESSTPVLLEPQEATSPVSSKKAKKKKKRKSTGIELTQDSLAAHAQDEHPVIKDRELTIQDGPAQPAHESESLIERPDNVQPVQPAPTKDDDSADSPDQTSYESVHSIVTVPEQPDQSAISDMTQVPVEQAVNDWEDTTSQPTPAAKLDESKQDQDPRESTCNANTTVSEESSPVDAAKVESQDKASVPALLDDHRAMELKPSHTPELPTAIPASSSGDQAQMDNVKDAEPAPTIDEDAPGLVPTVEEVQDSESLRLVPKAKAEIKTDTSTPLAPAEGQTAKSDGALSIEREASIDIPSHPQRQVANDDTVKAVTDSLVPKDEVSDKKLSKKEKKRLKKQGLQAAQESALVTPPTAKPVDESKLPEKTATQDVPSDEKTSSKPAIVPGPEVSPSDKQALPKIEKSLSVSADEIPKKEGIMSWRSRLATAASSAYGYISAGSQEAGEKPSQPANTEVKKVADQVMGRGTTTPTGINLHRPLTPGQGNKAFKHNSILSAIEAAKAQSSRDNSKSPPIEGRSNKDSKDDGLEISTAQVQPPPTSEPEPEPGSVIAQVKDDIPSAAQPTNDDSQASVSKDVSLVPTDSASVDKKDDDISEAAELEALENKNAKRTKVGKKLGKADRKRYEYLQAKVASGDLVPLISTEQLVSDKQSLQPEILPPVVPLEEASQSKFIGDPDSSISQKQDISVTGAEQETTKFAEGNLTREVTERDEGLSLGGGMGTGRIGGAVEGGQHLGNDMPETETSKVASGTPDKDEHMSLGGQRLGEEIGHEALATVEEIDVERGSTEKKRGTTRTGGVDDMKEKAFVDNTASVAQREIDAFWGLIDESKTTPGHKNDTKTKSKLTASSEQDNVPGQDRDSTVNAVKVHDTVPQTPIKNKMDEEKSTENVVQVSKETLKSAMKVDTTPRVEDLDSRNSAETARGHNQQLSQAADFEESPILGRGEGYLPQSTRLGLLLPEPKMEDPVGGLLKEDAEASALVIGHSFEVGTGKPTKARSLPKAQDFPEPEGDRIKAPPMTPKSHRTSSFTGESITTPPLSSRGYGDGSDEWSMTTSSPRTPMDNRKIYRKPVGSSPFKSTTVYLHEPSGPEVTPEPEKRRTSSVDLQAAPVRLAHQRSRPSLRPSSSRRRFGEPAMDPPLLRISRSREYGELRGAVSLTDLTSTTPYRSVSDHSKVPSVSGFESMETGRDLRRCTSISGIGTGAGTGLIMSSGLSLSRRSTPEPLKLMPESVPQIPGTNFGGSTPLPASMAPVNKVNKVNKVVGSGTAAVDKLEKSDKVEKRVGGDVKPIRQSTNSTPVANEGRVRAKDITDVYDGFGEGRIGSPRSPTKPHSMRRRQSIQVLDLEARVEQLMAENRMLSEARSQTEQNLSHRATAALSERDSEIEALKQSLHFLQSEVSRLTEVNTGLSSANAELAVKDNSRYADLEVRHTQTARELDEARGAQNAFQQSLHDKDAEIADLRAQLQGAKEQIREMQRQILAAKAKEANFLKIQDEDHFDHRCQQLCSHLKQWVLRFSKFSDMRACRLTSEIDDDKIIDRLDNCILDGSEVDYYLGDRVKRRDIFMSMVTHMIFEFIFTRYLFGMDREQRQKLKSLEKMLTEVGPPQAVRQWRAVTLTLLSRRASFREQRDLDTEAVVQAILETLGKILPPPSNLEAQVQSQLRKVIREAVDLSIEMRTQKAEYMMLPPLQPEFDAEGELAAMVPFDASMMNARSDKGPTNEELEAEGVNIRCVLFPLVVKRGDDDGVGDEEIVVCPAQVLVAGDKRRLGASSEAGGSHAGRSQLSVVTGMA